MPYASGTRFRLMWFDKNLRNIRDTLCMLRDAAVDSNDDELKEIYRRYRVYYRNALQVAKINASSTYIKNSANKSKASWTIVNRYRREALSHANNTMTPDEVNRLFVDSAREIIGGILRPDISPLVWMPNNTFPGFDFNPVTTNDIRQAFLALKCGNSRDIYGLSVNLIKGCRELLLRPLKDLINSSFKTGIFPDLLKTAAVIPIPKKGKTGDLRPISILPVFSKIYEKLMSQQILRYLEKHDILNAAQFGFRMGMGTQNAVARILDEVITAFENGEFALLCTYDLSKAFDCLDHGILLSKLRTYGFKKKSCDLIASYFQGRTQIVRMESEHSEPIQIKTGTAQGSILGPLLFIIFLNDLPHYLKDVVSVLYADDSNTVLRGKLLEDVVERSNQTYIGIEKWFSCNGFAMNKEKSGELMLTLRKHNLKLKSFSVNVLGVHIDPTLSWNIHGDVIAKRLCKSVFLLRRLSFAVDRSVLRMTYFAVCHSLLTYCVLLWGHSAIAHRIFALQRRAVRIVGHAEYRQDCRVYL